MKNHSELQKVHKSVLKLVREQVKKHSFGKLVFLSSIGPRAWGFAPDDVDYDYQGIYISKEDNTYWASISRAEVDNGYAKNIILISFERIIKDILHSDIRTLVFINSPIIYASKEFLGFKKWVNSNLSKQIFETCQARQSHVDRKDYLYDFFFMGNGITILEKKKIIANLSELNKKILKIPAINKVIKEERAGLPFKSEQLYKKILRQLKTRLEKANKKPRLPEEINQDKFAKLKIMKKIDYKYWIQEGFIPRYQKEQKKYKMS